MTTKYTPGPWTFFKGQKGAAGQCMKFIVGSNKQGFAHTVGLSEPTDTANARLIAKAPELADIAREVSEYDAELIDPHMELSRLRNIARALLAEIEGD